MKAFIMAIALFGLAGAVQAEESVKERRKPWATM
jgi:hypothetical protein